MNRQPLTDNSGEVRELITEDFKHLQEPSEVLPKDTVNVLLKRGRPSKSDPKKQLTIRLNSEIVEFFKAYGQGWQTRINEILQKHVDSHRVT